MIHKMFSIHDAAAKVFHPPFAHRTHGEAERMFTANINNEKNGHLYESSKDYTLCYVGDWDDETGKFEAKTSPEAVLSGLQAKQPNNVRPIAN